jgi:MFS transporter, putative metabolite:H+ symporter
MYLESRDMGYKMVGMQPDAPMLIGMALILLGLALSLAGLLPRGAEAIRERGTGLRVRAMDDAPIRPQHVGLLVVLALAVTIDVMKPTTLSFVAPGVAKEYGLRTATNPLGTVPVTWLPLAGIAGTVAGSLLWGWIGDRIGRRASILLAGILFISTSVCGAMPGFEWNLLMCFLMGVGAGGMLPIAFTLIAETIPARHRGWVIVLIGGNTAGAYVVTSSLAGALTPEFGWRILWLIGLPTGLLLILLNRWIPESPRYLIAAGKPDEAAAIMKYYGAKVVTDEPEAEPAPLLGGGLVGSTLAVGGLAVAVGLLTFGFQFWVPTNLQHLGLTEVSSDYVLRDSALLGLPLTVVAALLYGFWSSRGTVALLSALTAVSVLAFALFGGSAVHHTPVLLVLLIVPLAGISSVTALVTAYGSEIYPTRIRARGSGLIAAMTKAGGVLVLAMALVTTANPSNVWTGLVGAIPLLAAVLVFLRCAPDTHQRHLEDIAPSLIATEDPA